MDDNDTGAEIPVGAAPAASRKRRRGSRGGQGRRKPQEVSGPLAVGDAEPAELPEPLREGRASVEAAERALVRKPQIGDTRPAPKSTESASRASGNGGGGGKGSAERKSDTADAKAASAMVDPSGATSCACRCARTWRRWPCSRVAT